MSHHLDLASHLSLSSMQLHKKFQLLLQGLVLNQIRFLQVGSFLLLFTCVSRTEFKISKESSSRKALQEPSSAEIGNQNTKDKERNGSPLQLETPELAGASTVLRHKEGTYIKEKGTPPPWGFD